MRSRCSTDRAALAASFLLAGISAAGCCCRPVTYSVATYAVPYTYAYTYTRAPDPAPCGGHPGCGGGTPVAIVQPAAPYAVVPPTGGCLGSSCSSAVAGP